MLVLCGLIALPCGTRAQEPEIQKVQVTATREREIKKVDKTVHNVANLIRAENGTAQDVLQSLPGVSLSADGQIAVKGNKQVTVLVDGKPTAIMSGDDRAMALQTMSGADIASVEVITNPSASYSANGGAILNIVLKKNRTPGAHTQVRASAADHGLWNAATSGDFTRANISVHGNVAYRRDGTLKYRQSEIDWNNPLNGQAGQSLQASEVFVRRIVESAAFGIDGALSNTDSLSLSATYNGRRSRPVFDVFKRDLSGATETISHRISNGPNEQSDSGVSLSYSHQDGNGVLKAVVQRSSTTGLIDKSYSDVFLMPERATTLSRGATHSARRLNQATVDWTGKLEHGQLGMGVDIRRHVDGIANYQAFVDQTTGAETPDPATTNGYAVTTTLTAVYVTDQIRYEKWELLLGGRAEQMALQVDPVQGNMQAGRWQAINPSFHLRYALRENADLTFSYRRSLQSPDARDLNPFTAYVDAQNLSRGNPHLQPQRLDSWEVGANADVSGLSGNVSAFYRASTDTVTDARSFADNVIITSKTNGGQARSAGMTGALDWKPDAKLRFGIDGGVYRVMLDSPDLGVLVRQSGISGYVNLSAECSFGNSDVSVDAHGLSAGISPLGRYGSTSSVNLSWKHKFSKTLSFTLNANDMFDGSRRTYQTDTQTFRLHGYDHFVARRISVGFVKKFE
ncbi:MAG: TonB-dependent receptor [Telluria sp.]